MKPHWKYNHKLETWVYCERGLPAADKRIGFEFLAACVVSALIWAGILCLF